MDQQVIYEVFDNYLKACRILKINTPFAEKIKEQKRVAVIGHVTSDKGSYQFISKGEQVHKLTAQGWNSIMKKD